MDHVSRKHSMDDLPDATPSGGNPYPSLKRMTAEEEREVKAAAKGEPYKPRHARSSK